MPKATTSINNAMKREIAHTSKEEGFKTPADWLFKQIVLGLRAAASRRAKSKVVAVPPELDHPV